MMLAHELTDAIILAYLNGELDSEQQSRIAELLANDVQVRARVQRLRRLGQLLHTTLDAADAIPPPPERVWQHIRVRTTFNHPVRRKLRPMIKTMIFPVSVLLAIGIAIFGGIGQSLDTNQPNTITPSPIRYGNLGTTVLPLADTHPTWTATPAILTVNATGVPPSPMSTVEGGAATPTAMQSPITATATVSSGPISPENVQLCTAQAPRFSEGPQVWLSDPAPAFGRVALLCMRFVQQSAGLPVREVYVHIEQVNILTGLPAHEDWRFEYNGFSDPESNIGWYELQNNQAEPLTPITITVDMVLPNAPEQVYRTIFVYSIAGPTMSNGEQPGSPAYVDLLRATLVAATAQVNATQQAQATAEQPVTAQAATAQAQLPTQTQPPIGQTQAPPATSTLTNKATLTPVTSNGPTATPGTVNRPTATPGTVNRPTATPGTVNQPTATPGTVNQPTATPGTVNRPTATPGTVNRPTATPGTVNRPTATPGAVNQPTATPGTANGPTATPGTVNRPTATPGAVNQPTATPSTAN